MQIGAIGVSYSIAWLLAARIRQFLEKDIDKVKAHMRFTVSQAHFAIMLKYVFWLLLVWFCQALFKEFTIPAKLLHMTFNLILNVVCQRGARRSHYKSFAK